MFLGVEASGDISLSALTFETFLAVQAGGYIFVRALVAGSVPVQVALFVPGGALCLAKPCLRTVNTGCPTAASHGTTRTALG